MKKEKITNELDAVEALVEVYGVAVREDPDGYVGTTSEAVAKVYSHSGPPGPGAELELLFYPSNGRIFLKLPVPRLQWLRPRKPPKIPSP